MGVANTSETTAPVGGATAAKQDTAQTTLTQIRDYLDTVETLLAAATPAGTNSIGTVALTPSTPVQFLDVDETEDEVKATAGTLHGYFLANLSAGVRYVKFYDGPAASIAVGTDTPKLTIPLAAGEKANLALPRGLAFASGICIAATTGFAVADTGAPGANDVIADVFYT